MDDIDNLEEYGDEFKSGERIDCSRQDHKESIEYLTNRILENIEEDIEGNFPGEIYTDIEEETQSSQEGGIEREGKTPVGDKP